MTPTLYLVGAVWAVTVFSMAVGFVAHYWASSPSDRALRTMSDQPEASSNVE